MKQKSEKWFELRKEAKVTGSTLYKSIGLDTLKKQKEHYEEFIEKKQPRNSLLKFKKKLDHGIKHEVRIMTLKTWNVNQKH